MRPLVSDGSPNVDFIAFWRNFVAYPCIHFMLCNNAPIISGEKCHHEQLSVTEVTVSVSKPTVVK